MSSQKRTREARPKKQAQPKNRPAATTESIPQGEPESLKTSPLLTSPGDTSIQSHTSQLNDTQTPPHQRQMMAAQLGQIGGNQYLQRVMSHIRPQGGEAAVSPQPSPATSRGLTPTPHLQRHSSPQFNPEETPIQAKRVEGYVQRHTSTELEYEENSIQAKRVEGYVQRHTATELQYEENSIQAKSLVIQRSNLVDKLNDAMGGWGTDEEAITKAISEATEAEKQEALKDPRIVARLKDELSRGEALKALTDLGAPLSMRLETAMDGWGAASAEILKMIDELPAARAAEKDAVLRNPGLIAKLREELSREDAIKAMKGLGAPLAERLRTAMQGWGVDEAAVEAMINDADATQRQAAVKDRALIAELKSEVSYEKLQAILKTLGVSLIDRLNVAMDGWGVDAAGILEMSKTATEPEKAQVLGDAVTLTRLGRELEWAAAMTVMTNLGMSLADRLHAAMDGWGADSGSILAVIPTASEDERLAVYADTATMARLEAELSAEDFCQVKLLLRFGSQEAIDAASKEELEKEETPENLTALISAQLDSGAPDAGKITSDIVAASDTDRALVLQNHALLRRLAGALEEEAMRQVIEQLGGTIVDRLNLLIDQEEPAADILTLVTNASADNKQLILNNRSLLDRLLEYMGTADDTALMTALGDSLINQLNHALDEKQDENALYNLIKAATEAARSEVELDATLMSRFATTFPPLTFWKIRLHLEYGEPAKYPADLVTLISAWEGDASYDNIRRTLANLATPSFNVIKEVAGIRDVLRVLIPDEVQHTFILRMLDQGLITEETDIEEKLTERLQVDDPSTPALDFISKEYVATRGFDVSYYRDKVQVEVRVKLNPTDEASKAKVSELITRWEGGIEGTWDNRYSLRNANHTLPIRVNCNFTTDDPHHTVDIRQGPARSNQGTWDTEDTGRVAAHEFGHMLGNLDEYDLAAADYQSTVGVDPTTDPNATKGTDAAGKEKFTNPSVMGSNIGPNPDDPGSVDPRHLNYFTNWINKHRRKNADNTFAEPAFTLI